MKYLTRLFHKKGFTLTELIIVIAIIGLLMLSLVTFSAPVRLMVTGTDARAETLSIANTIGNYLEHTLAYADDVRVYAGVDISNGSAALAAINDVYDKMQDAHDGSNDRTGMIVFHYVLDQNDPLRSGHRVYELSASDTDGKQLVVNKVTESTTGTEYQVIDDKKLLYFPDFYGKYCFFLEADNDQAVNKTLHYNNIKRKSFMKFNIKAYYFDGSLTKADNSAIYLDEITAKSHYEYQGDPHVEDGVNGLKAQFETDNVTIKKIENTPGLKAACTGTENVFFGLENFKLCDPPEKVDQPPFYNLGYTNPTTAVTSYGTDVVILYNIHTYTHDFSS